MQVAGNRHATVRAALRVVHHDRVEITANDGRAILVEKGFVRGIRRHLGGDGVNDAVHDLVAFFRAEAQFLAEMAVGDVDGLGHERIARAQSVLNRLADFLRVLRIANDDIADGGHANGLGFERLEVVDHRVAGGRIVLRGERAFHPFLNGVERDFHAALGTGKRKDLRAQTFFAAIVALRAQVGDDLFRGIIQHRRGRGGSGSCNGGGLRRGFAFFHERENRVVRHFCRERHLPLIQQGFHFFSHFGVLVFDRNGRVVVGLARALRRQSAKFILDLRRNFFQAAQVKRVRHRQIVGETIAITLFQRFIAVHEFFRAHVRLDFVHGAAFGIPVGIHVRQRVAVLFQAANRLVELAFLRFQFVGVAGGDEKRARVVRHAHGHARHETGLAGLQQHVAAARREAEDFGVHVAVRAVHLRHREGVPHVAAGRMDVEQNFFARQRLEFVLVLLRGIALVAVIIRADLSVDGQFAIVTGGCKTGVRRVADGQPRAFQKSVQHRRAGVMRERDGFQAELRAAGVHVLQGGENGFAIHFFKSSLALFLAPGFPSMSSL